jgi:hypothetical protein
VTLLDHRILLPVFGKDLLQVLRVGSHDLLAEVWQEEVCLDQTVEVAGYNVQKILLLFPMFFNPDGYPSTLCLSSGFKGSYWIIKFSSPNDSSFD